MNRRVARLATNAMGTLRNRIQRQLNASVRIPPNSGPVALPKPAAPSTMPLASAARFLGSTVNVMARTAGHINAPPTHMSARATMSRNALGAIPASKEKIVAPARNIRRRPYRSASRPPVTMKTPKMTA